MLLLEPLLKDGNKLIPVFPSGHGFLVNPHLWVLLVRLVILVYFFGTSCSSNLVLFLSTGLLLLMLFSGRRIFITREYVSYWSEWGPSLKTLVLLSFSAKMNIILCSSIWETLSIDVVCDNSFVQECLIVDSFSEREETDDVATLVLYWLNSLCSFSL